MLKEYICEIAITAIFVIISILINHWRKAKGIKTPYEKKIIEEYKTEKKQKASKNIEDYPSFTDENKP